MANKRNIRICRYIACKHDTKEINITQDEYMNKGSMYYHKDCFELSQNGEWKTNKEKQDFQEIRRLWYENIDREVVFQQLNRILDGLLKKGNSSDYLLFIVKYILEHDNLKLNYPAGLYYYVGNQEIKNAYEIKRLRREISKKGEKVFRAVEKNDAPKFTPNISKPKGFQSILNK